MSLAHWFPHSRQSITSPNLYRLALEIASLYLTQGAQVCPKPLCSHLFSSVIPRRLENTKFHVCLEMRGRDLSFPQQMKK